MALVLRHREPRMVRRGVTTLLTADVRDEGGGAVTVTGTFTLTDGDEEVVAATAITPVLGGGATFSLTSTVTTSREHSDQLLERWVVVSGGASYELTRPMYLVRCVFTPVLTPTDLTNEYSTLTEILDPDLDSFEQYVTDARERIERELIKKGRRPDLIFDSWALFDAHRHLTLHMIFKDSKSSIGDGRYADLADWHYAEFIREIETAEFRYDSGQTGTITSSAQEGATPPILLTAGRPRSRYGLRYG